MSVRKPNGDGLSDLFERTKTIAVVGLSSKRHRASYAVASYMQKQGYRIIPVNPNEQEVLGEKCYPDLKSIPVPVDMVDVFRRSEYVPQITEQAMEIGAPSMWLQLGVNDKQAEEKALQAGMEVVQGVCLMVEHQVHGNKK